MAERMYKKVGKGSDRRLEPRLNKDDKWAAHDMAEGLKSLVRDAYKESVPEWLSDVYPDVLDKLEADDNFATAFEIEVFKYFYRRK